MIPDSDDGFEVARVLNGLTSMRKNTCDSLWLLTATMAPRWREYSTVWPRWEKTLVIHSGFLDSDGGVKVARVLNGLASMGKTLAIYFGS